jgi:N-hydroxyarylamine O-acetyltransferase
MFNFNDYAARIGIDTCEATEAGLLKLQWAQLATIAFDDIEPFLSKVPSLQPADIWAKLVLHRRGGYCFELNWLFGEALKQLGFQARPVLGRVRMGAPQGGIRAHLAWIVTINGTDWLADAGFGGPGPREPVEIRAAVQEIRGTRFRFQEDRDSGELVLERQNPDGWFALFGFDETRFAPVDVEAANYLCALWPTQPFRNNLMLSIRLADEDVALLNRRLTRAGAAGVRSFDVTSQAELAGYLSDLFGISCDAETVAQLWARLDVAQLAAA